MSTSTPRVRSAVVGLLFPLGAAVPIASQAGPGEPAPDQGKSAVKIGKTLAESIPGTAPEIPVSKGAPNVIWILLDDVGYGASSAFAGGARTPVLDSLLKNGLTSGGGRGRGSDPLRTAPERGLGQKRAPTSYRSPSPAGSKE